MKIVSTFLCVTVAVGLAFLPRHVAGSEISLFEITDAAGSRVDYPVPRDELLATPEWSVDRSPPLSVPDAVGIARRRLKPAAPSDLTVTSVRLSAVGTEDGFRWYYDVEAYDSSQLEGPEPPPIRRAIILLSGRVVEPRKTER